MAKKFVYKIQDEKTGLFSTGGMSPQWTKKGKVWNSMGSLKCHLRQFLEYGKEKDDDGIMVTNFRVHYNKIPKTWKVIEIELIERENIHISAHHLYPEKIED